MKILITGAKGQLGSALRSICREYPSFDLIYTDIEELDITSEEALEDFFSQHKPSTCINGAAYTAVDQAETDKDKAFLLNADAVKKLGEVTARHGAKLIHISTDYVFNGQMWEPYKEMDTPNPTSVYGQSKAAGEASISQMDHSMIIRTSWLYSEFGKNFFKTMAQLVQTRPEIRVVSDQVGTPTYAGDLARALFDVCMKIYQDKFLPGIYHYSNEGIASWFDFAWEIAQISGSSCKVIPIETHEYPLPAPRPSYSVLNKSRIKSIYGVKVPYWKESLQVCHRNFLKTV